MTTKSIIRSEVRRRRSAFAISRSHATPVWPQFNLLLSSSAIIGGYIPIGAEADPARYLAAARESGCSTALPRVESHDGDMHFHRWDTGQPLEDGPLGLQQPPVHCDIVQPDIILLPLLAFTRYGARLGQGAGHYDRAIAAHPHCLCVGIAWSVQEYDSLPTDPWDMPLHAVATETEWIAI